MVRVVAVTCLLLLIVGYTRTSRVKRVIGGKVIDSAARWPWMVSLRGKIPTFRLFGITMTSTNVICGGSLIGSRWVLTAAHCVMRKELGLWSLVPQYWTVRMGDIKRDADLGTDIRDFFAEALNVDEGRDWDIDADRVFVHPGYNAEDAWIHDIALLKLTREAPVTNYADGVPFIRQVSLDAGNTKKWPKDGTKCMFKGWGCAELGGNIQNVARQVELVKVNDAKCGRIWNIKMESRVCAGDKYTGICQGDSGGPLVCQSSKGDEWMQVGVASFTALESGNPGVFASVANHNDWIQNTIANNREPDLHATNNSTILAKTKQ